MLARLRGWRDRAPLVGGLVRGLARVVKRLAVVVPFGEARGLRFRAPGGTLGYALGLEEPLVQRALRAHLRPGQTFYDLGANVGFFTLLGARRVGPSGRVYAFEPLPEAAAQLRANVARNGFAHVEVVEAAASDRAGTATLLVGAASQVAKLEGAPGPLGVPARSVQVPVVALDALVESGAIAPPDFVKIDVEGAETAALRGMEQTLRRHRPGVLCELHGTHADVAAVLRACGYELHVLEGPGAVEDAAEFAHVLAFPAGRG